MFEETEIIKRIKLITCNYEMIIIKIVIKH